MTCFDDIDNDELSHDMTGENQEELIDLNSYPVNEVLNVLLQDKTTKKNIIWATDSYYSSDHKCRDKDQIKIDVFRTGIPVVLKPRSQKDSEDQQQRTRKKAEVFTPEWICNQMNNHCDEEWFGRSDIFNHINVDNTWTVTESKIAFSSDNEWKNYVDSRRLEITCGEAPFIVSRYDAATGELIYPLYRRTGILDRKLRIVNENTDNLEDWTKWVIRAFQSCYGYEWQGDNLLIARINLLMTFYDYYRGRWGSEPELSLLKQITNIITWNFWQMNGLEDTVPFGKPYQKQRQMTLMDSFDKQTEERHEDTAFPCKIHDWRRNKSLQFMNIKKVGNMSKKLFDFVIGNPPYQDENVGDQKNYKPPVYNLFIDESYKIAERVELIHPARFLFNAGSTPVAWNKKMLNDEHLKVVHYEADGDKIFPHTDIIGGVAITYHDVNKNFGTIEVFTAHAELNSILKKVYHSNNFESMEKIVVSRTAYRLTDKLHKDYPDAINQLSNGHVYDMSSNIFERLPQVFHSSKPDDGQDYVRMLGRKDNGRISMYIKREYINDVPNLECYKVILARAYGATGTVSGMKPTRVIGTPVVEKPHTGTTESFLSIGFFTNELEANNALKYVKTKFARVLLGILKITQDITPGKWKYVPIQNFTNNSEICWSEPIKKIDEQLYKKYNLSAEEIEFIETHVQEMK